MATYRKWIPFREFFALARQEGLSREEAAESLLLNIKAPTAHKLVRGHLRRWELFEEPVEKSRARDEVECWRQHLGWKVRDRDPTPDEQEAFAALQKALNDIGERVDSQEVPVPPQEVYPSPGYWGNFETIDRDCMAQWVDDEDEPEEGGTADLIAGQLSWDWSGADRDEWTALEIDEVFAKAIIKHHGQLVAPHSGKELVRLIKSWPDADGDAFWNLLKDGPRLGCRTQAEVRRAWRTIRGTAGKRGRPRKPK